MNGTGLGLYMSKTIVEKHLQGTLKFYNKDDGLCFEIILPYTIEDKS
jgi:signal transduction histidine kinase